MKLRFEILKKAIVLLALVSTLAMVGIAQEGQGIVGNGRQKPLPPGGPAPRLADGHVSFAGVWYTGVYGMLGSNGGGQGTITEAPIPFQPWAAEKIKGLTATQLQLEQARVNCTPMGVPGLWLFSEFPFQFVQLPGVLVQLIETNNAWRLVHTDGRAHEKDPDPSFNGDAVGHWEGDTLVIDVIAIDERTFNNTTGWFHSDQEHVIEHIRRPSMNYLTYQYTIEDPKVLTKPWTSAVREYSLGPKNDDLLEYYCTNNQELEQFKKLQSQESDGEK
jgi:hypothetical protein